MRNLFTLLFLLSCIQIQSQSWHWINPSTGFLIINDIGFISPDEGFAVGNNGSILHYTNGEWSLMDSPVTANLNAVEYVSQNLALAVGEDGTILKYINGSWSQVVSPVNGALNDICCIGENSCRAVGSAIIHYNGNEWQLEESIGNLETVGFLSESLGWASGSSLGFYKFENGIWSPDNSFSSYFLSFKNLEKAGSLMLLNGITIPEEGLIFENDGTGWIPTDSGNCNNSISFTDEQHGFGLQNAGLIFYDLFPTVHHYSDGVWQPVYVHEKRDQTFTAVEAYSSKACMVSDNLGYIHRIDDGSHSFANGFMSDSIMDMQFVQPNKGFLAGHSSGLWKYEEGEWSNIFNLPACNVNIIDFPDANSGYFGAFMNNFFPFWPETKLFSYNYGIITEIIFPDEYSFISSLNSVGEDLVFTQRNTILTYTNGLITTERIALTDSISELRFMLPFPINSNFRNDDWEAAWMSVKRQSSEVSGVICYKYFIDNTWQEVYETTTGIFNDLCVYDYNQVVAVGTNGLIAVFDGTNWSEITPLTTEELLSVHLDEYRNGWAVGRNGTILQCIGGTWSVYENNTTFDLNIVSFYDNTLGFIGGNEGTMLCTQPQLPVGNNYSIVGNTKDVLGIFPNPTKDNALVQFSAMADTPTELKMTDLTGRLVFEQSLTTTGAGIQTVPVNLQTMKNGIYLVKVISGAQILTGKILKQK
ncbi:MAG: T9SS type A sorting domain-containing protein [Bacteroidota bacterium]